MLKTPLLQLSAGEKCCRRPDLSTYVGSGAATQQQRKSRAATTVVKSSNSSGNDSQSVQHTSHRCCCLTITARMHSRSACCASIVQASCAVPSLQPPNPNANPAFNTCRVADNPLMCSTCLAATHFDQVLLIACWGIWPWPQAQQHKVPLPAVEQQRICCCALLHWGKCGRGCCPKMCATD